MNAASSDRSVKKTFKTITTQILLLFLVVTFGVWGIGDIVRGGSQMDVAKVGSRHITIGAYQQELQSIREESQGQIPDVMLNSPMFRQQVVGKLVQNTLVEEAALDAGLIVDDSAIAERLRKDPYFQDLKGKFNAQQFKQFLDAQRITEAQFVDSIARQTRAQALVSAYEMDQVSAVPALAALQAYSDAETRDLLVVSVTERDIEQPKPADDATLKAYYDEKKDDFFMQESTRDFVVLSISPDTLRSAAKEKAGKNVSGNEASAALVQTISNTLDDLVASGERFEDAAKKLGVPATIKTYKGISATAQSVDANILKLAFSLEESQSSSLETTKDGTIYALQVSHVVPETPKPFEKVRGELNRMHSEEALHKAVSGKAYDVAAALRDAKDDAERTAIINKFGVTSSTLRNVKRGDRAASKLPLAVLSEVFSKDVGAFITPAPTPDAYVIPLVLAIHAPEGTRAVPKESEVQSLRVVRGMVSNALLNDFEKSVPVTLYELPKVAAQ